MFLFRNKGEDANEDRDWEDSDHKIITMTLHQYGHWTI